MVTLRRCPNSRARPIGARGAMCDMIAPWRFAVVLLVGASGAQGQPYLTPEESAAAATEQLTAVESSVSVVSEAAACNIIDFRTAETAKLILRRRAYVAVAYSQGMQAANAGPWKAQVARAAAQGTALATTSRCAAIATNPSLTLHIKEAVHAILESGMP